jgi:outer membrane immunogenic protein
MRKIAVGLFATCSMISIACAADLPRSVYKAPAMVAPVFSWTGFYIGANVGYGWGSGDGTATVGGITGPISGSSNGVIGGGQIGYNWQTGPIVFGVEADFQGSGVEGNVTGPGFINGRQSTDWFGTIRGRLGYAWDRTMLYATGGGVYSDNHIKGTSTINGLAFDNSQTSWSWTVGGGVEHMFMPNWSAKIEYLYIGTPDSVPTAPFTTALSGSVHGNVIRGGINYHF